MDYRELLLKYIVHVGACEGITFIQRENGCSLGPEFTDCEKEELMSLDEESKDPKFYQRSGICDVENQSSDISTSGSSSSTTKE